MTLKAELKIDRGRGYVYEPVPVERSPAPRSGRTQCGYGVAIPMDYMVTIAGRKHRVYCCIFSNLGTIYVKVKGQKIVVDIEEVTE